MSKKVKIFVIVIVIIAVLIALFSYIGNKTPAASTDGLTTSAPSQSDATLPGGGTGTAPVGNDFSSTLSSINGITLDTSIFTDPSYEALRDYPISLGTAVIGRQNPFAPIGADSSDTATPVLEVQALTPGKIIGTSAELGALVTVNNTSPVSVVFQYGTTDTFGNASAPVTAAQSGTALFTAKGLTPATTYYVEAVAVQGSTTATSTVTTFTTAAQ